MFYDVRCTPPQDYPACCTARINVTCALKKIHGKCAMNPINRTTSPTPSRLSRLYFTTQYTFPLSSAPQIHSKQCKSILSFLHNRRVIRLWQSFQQYTSVSKPIQSLPVLIHASAVVPLPIQLSNTSSPSFVYVLIKYSNKAIGFWVGCTRMLSCENSSTDFGQFENFCIYGFESVFSLQHESTGNFQFLYLFLSFGGIGINPCGLKVGAFL